jgi:hypothetical protein
VDAREYVGSFAPAAELIPIVILSAVERPLHLYDQFRSWEEFSIRIRVEFLSVAFRNARRVGILRLPSTIREADRAASLRMTLR